MCDDMSSLTAQAHSGHSKHNNQSTEQQHISEKSAIGCLSIRVPSQTVLPTLKERMKSFKDDEDEPVVFPKPYEDHSYGIPDTAPTVPAEPVDAAVQVDGEANGDTPMNRRIMMRNMILTDDTSVRFYTGLPTKGVLQTIYEPPNRHLRVLFLPPVLGDSVR
ncbi:hypothetical protein Pcinc_022934 [Petrolisthes cinctipes]|uniref:Uncharacterized protein n=1 Tax=Petrolisthes cinctipes TaxID=88211 RepID=A0AAE1FEN2_PETCI|nr:hypothetical protein Pcinc_022934 [Petrolisthes cinctipes]